MKIQSLIKEGSKYLENNNISSHTLDSEILMSKILKKDRKYLILNPNYKLNMNQLKNLHSTSPLLCLRISGVHAHSGMIKNFS